MLAALLVGAGVGALLFFWMGPPRGTGPVREEPPPLEFEPERGSEGSPTERADPEASTLAGEIWVLELDSPGGSGEPAPDERPAEVSQAAPSRPGLVPLWEGRGQVLFAVEDASGRRLRDVSVTLRQLDPGGGADHAVTDGRGDARFRGLAPGPYTYRAQAPGRREVVAAASFVLDEGEHKRVTVRLGGSDLSIRGRVRNRRGEPVPGIEISAVRHYFASSVSEDEAGDGSHRGTRSREDGSFAIGGLTEGEYEVQTTATQHYAALKVTLQAGAEPTDLILAEGLAVHGTVVDPDGEPLARVWVGLPGDRDRFAYSDDRGRYQLQLDLGADSPADTLRFYLAGYQEQLLGLPIAERGGAGELRLDAELLPVEDAASVSGVVRTERGDPIDRATVLFASPELGTNYQAVSDTDGYFAIRNVVTGPGYQLRVLPDGSFGDHSQHRIRVPEDGVSLEIVLEPLPTGRLSGRMHDVDGNPVPEFRLWLLSRGAVRSALPISSDERGYFELEEAPAGSLTFDTRASPRHVVKGIVLPAGGEREVSLVLDWGAQVMAGEVVDDRGDPVAGAEVFLTWSNTNGEVRSTSRRQTRTEPTGSFRFMALGPGEHRLEVRAPGYRTTQERHDVGAYASDVQVRLEPMRP
jgi:protocatechuate 3,4-dioxygenase beta subunit